MVIITGGGNCTVSIDDASKEQGLLKSGLLRVGDYNDYSSAAGGWEAYA